MVRPRRRTLGVVTGSTTPLAVLGISGSLRRGSYNTALLRAAGEEMPDDMTLEIADIGDVPVYNRDDEREHGFPPSVANLRARVAAADALLVATPEYNYSVPGALKNAWDWLSRQPDPPIDAMPLAILGTGGRLGTARAQQHFRDIARHNDLRVVQKPEVLVPDAWTRFDDDLRLTDERTRDQVRRLVAALRALTLRERATLRRVLVVGGDGRAATQLREVGFVVSTRPADESAGHAQADANWDLVAVHVDAPAQVRARLGDRFGTVVEFSSAEELVDRAESLRSAR